MAAHVARRSGSTPIAVSGAGTGAGGHWQRRAQIALIRMPRLLMSFRFDGVQAPDRQSFMRYFDLYMLKGGG